MNRSFVRISRLSSLFIIPILVLTSIACIPLSNIAVESELEALTKKFAASRTERRTLLVDDRNWTYTLYVPGSIVSESAPPLLILLHGTGERGLDPLVLNGWIELAELNGFVVAAPDAPASAPDQPPDFLLNPPIWNAGQPYLTEARRAIDDLAFFDALLTEVPSIVPIDTGRAFVAGHSGGAAMAFRLAAERSEQIAAIAAVASPLWLANPAPAAAVPTLYIVGMSDPIVPAAGGRQALPWFTRESPPIEAIIARWADALGCSTGTIEMREGALRRIVHTSCSNNALFEAILIDGQGHGWPGGRTPQLPEIFIGPSTSHLDAAAAIWDFFERAS